MRLLKVMIGISSSIRVSGGRMWRIGAVKRRRLRGERHVAELQVERAATLLARGLRQVVDVLLRVAAGTVLVLGGERFAKLLVLLVIADGVQVDCLSLRSAHLLLMRLGKR